mgnify:CR=1 FL=1
MNYKETFYFVTTCLTISLESKNRLVIEKQLQSDTIDWDAVVKLSTTHYVFPALYCNLKREGFLKYLPQDLVSYMKYITKLNRERNQQIITQAKELNSLLLAINITPIFLKGTANLLAGLYNDVAERMVGDIDLIIPEESYLKVIETLKKDNYYRFDNRSLFYSKDRHYPRLVKVNEIAAVEVHKDILIDKYQHVFNYKVISKDIQVINNSSVLSFENKLSLSILASQINDYGHELMSISLRNAYDVLLLSKKVNTKNSFLKFNVLRKPINCFLAICNDIFGGIDSLKFHKTEESDLYLNNYNKTFFKNIYIKRYLKTILIHTRRRVVIMYKSIFIKEDRLWLFGKIVNKIFKV